MARAMPGYERDSAPANGRERYRPRRRAKRRIDLEVLDVVEKFIETRSTKDANGWSLAGHRCRFGTDCAHVADLLDESFAGLELAESEAPLLDVELDEEVSLEPLSDVVVDVEAFDELSLSFDLDRERDRDESLLSVL